MATRCCYIQNLANSPATRRYQTMQRSWRKAGTSGSIDRISCAPPRYSLPSQLAMDAYPSISNLERALLPVDQAHARLKRTHDNTRVSDDMLGGGSHNVWNAKAANASVGVSLGSQNEELCKSAPASTEDKSDLESLLWVRSGHWRVRQVNGEFNAMRVGATLQV